MPVYPNPNSLSPTARRRLQAIDIVEKTGFEPLQEAIKCAVDMRAQRECMREELGHAVAIEHRTTLQIAIFNSIADEKKAWMDVASYVYAKPRQSVEVTGRVTLEQLLGDFEEKPVTTEAEIAA